MCKTKSPPRIASLHESTYSKPERIDTENGVIHRVKFLGRESKNGRVYSDRALAEAAGFYEGRDITLDHDRKDPKRDRHVMESIGKARNVRVEADGVYGDIDYWTTHPATPVVIERIKRSPDGLGLSHNADGKLVSRSKKLVVESISRVNSIDLVLRPATCNSLFESEGTPMPTIRQILESCAPGKTKGCKLFEMEGMADMPVPEAPEPTATNADEQIRAAFKAALQAVLDDDALDMKATLAKVKDILAAREKLLNGGEAAPDLTPADSETDDEESAAESLAAKAINKAMAPLIEGIGKIVERLEQPGQRPKPIIESTANKGRTAKPGSWRDAILVE